MTSELVVGVDAGGTSTRCVIATTEGTLCGYGTAGGANQHSSADPAAALRTALTEAFAQLCPPDQSRQVVSGVFGIAGASTRPQATAAAVEQAWAQVGLAGMPEVIDDIAVAFAAGSTAPSGTVLVSGTGAVAARIHHGRVDRRADGHGWLVGDEGSGVWLALSGLRAVLAAMDGRGPATVLSESLAEALDVPAHTSQQLLGAAYDCPPAELGRLAPLVTAAAAAADPVADRIVAEAARRLVDTVTAVGPAREEPIVLAGSVLATQPVGDLVRSGLSERFGADSGDSGDGGMDLVSAGPGELGAVGLALSRLGATTAHATLLRHGLVGTKNC